MLFLKKIVFVDRAIEKTIMAKLILLKFERGNFQDGFEVSLRVNIIDKQEENLWQNYES